MPHHKPQWSPLQCTAVLVLTRLAFFFCSGEPFTAAQVRGMLPAVLMQTALTLLLPRIPNIRRIAAPLLRLYAPLLAAWLIAEFWQLTGALHLPNRLTVMLLLCIALTDMLHLPQTAPARCSVLILTVTCAGFLLLIPRAAAHASPLPLFVQTEGAAADFLREWCFFPLGMLPAVLLPDSRSAAKAAAGFGIGRVLLAGLVLLGAMCSGRLTEWRGSSFFLLLSRLPLSDAVRTDGFWLLLTVSCVVISTGFLLQRAVPAENRKEFP